MEDRGSDAVVGGELGDSCVGAFGDDVAGDEAGGVGAVDLVEGVDCGFRLESWHIVLGEIGCVWCRLSPVSGNAAMGLAWFRVTRILEDGKQCGQEVDLDAGDGGEAEQAIFDLGRELGVGGIVGGIADGVEGDGCDEARGEVGKRRVGVGGEGRGADEAGGDDVGAGGGVAIA